jgi:mycofactocin precursor
MIQALNPGRRDNESNHDCQVHFVRGGTMPTETLIEELVVETEESEELLVEVVSIDGLCGVY